MAGHKVMCDPRTRKGQDILENVDQKKIMSEHLAILYVNFTCVSKIFILTNTSQYVQNVVKGGQMLSITFLINSIIITESKWENLQGVVS